jgi:mevalonate kinase
MKSFATASAPGKVILTGEHFVVNGAYSIAAAISKRAKVTLSETTGDSYITHGGRRSKLHENDGQFAMLKAILLQVLAESKTRRNFAVSIYSQIPSGSGLGSSAAVSVATSAATLKFFDLDTSRDSIFNTALLGERKVHGNPSGIDVEASIRGGMILFSKSGETRSIHLDRALQLLVIYSGKHRRTGALISKVAARKKRFPHFFDRLTNAASFMSLGMVDAISVGDLPRLGAFMNISQTALDWIGVSTPFLDKMLDDMASLDIFGAKLTGAGGGGSIIVLPKPEGADQVAKYADKKYPWSFLTQIPQEGLRWE